MLHRFSLIVGALLLAASASRAADDAEPPRAKGMTTSVEAQPIKALHYGDTLFNFFQDKHFSALTGLMTSQHFDRLAPHGDESEVLRGGLLLSYGVHGEAGRIFASLIEKGAAPSVRDRAWFYLAKIRYQRGFHADAEAALARIEGKLPAALAEERGLMQAQLQMARGDYAAAATLLGAMTSDPKKASPFARFNLGIALVKSGDTARGNALLDEIGSAPAENEEQRSLRDRANLALGVAALQEQRAADAYRFLERVRIESQNANKALLGYGWAAAAQKKPELALVSWTELAGRDASDPAVLEARIALPFAHAELGAYGQSLTLYESAVREFDSEGQRLEASIGAIRAGKLLGDLLERNPADEMGWSGTLRKLPEMPHAAHLAQVLAQHEFQEAFKNFRDLRFLEGNLEQWRDTLGVFRDMLEHRRAAFAARLQPTQDSAQAQATALAELRQRREGLAAEFARAVTDADGLAFANARQRGLLERVQGLQAALKTDGAKPEIAALAERIRLSAGVLAWELAQDFTTRRWELQKALGQIDQQLAQAGQREAALAQAQREEPIRFERFAARIEALSKQLDATLPRVTALKSEQQGVAQQVAEAALVGQKQRLVAYSSQAQFEIAQLIDRATVARNDAHEKR
ncbi:MAG: hypothetical protein Q8L49_15095 [Burkholderiaceae bacterium]|nr:hypothetical protein [Burkholderiaceae bacterium]